MAIDRQVPETSGPFASTAKPKSNNNNNYLSLAEGESAHTAVISMCYSANDGFTHKFTQNHDANGALSCEKKARTENEVSRG